MISDNSKQSAAYGVNLPQSPPKDDYINRLTMDMTSLEISTRPAEGPLAQTYNEGHAKKFRSDDSNWLSGLVESRASCETSNTYMYESMNSQLSQDKLSYSYDANMPSDLISSEELGFSNVNLPLLDYYPSYKVESDKLPEIPLSHTHEAPSLNALNPQHRLANSQYYTSVSSETISPLDMSFIKSYRKTLYQTKDSYVYLKILATQLVSGTIIGRGGKGLNWFRRKSKVDDIVLSMPWELYPKTEYRTLLLKGSLKSVIKSTCIIAELMNSRYSLLSDNTMMVMVVLPDIFLTAIDEIKRTTNPNLLSITLFRDENSTHQEIVAVLKGDKSKVKDLVAAISTSVSETVPPDKYCFVSYPNSDDYQFHLQNSDSGSDTIKRHSINPMLYPNYALKTQARDDVDSLLLQIESAADKGNLGTLSTISTLIKQKPELLSRPVDVQITLNTSIPEQAFAIASIYKCDLVQSDREGGAVQCRITGQFAGCFATLLFIYTKTPEPTPHA